MNICKSFAFDAHLTWVIKKLYHISCACDYIQLFLRAELIKWGSRINILELVSGTMIDGYLLAGQLNKSNVRPCQMESFRQSGQTRRNTQCGFSFAEQQGNGERQNDKEWQRERERGGDEASETAVEQDMSTTCLNTN